MRLFELYEFWIENRVMLDFATPDMLPAYIKLTNGPASAPFLRPSQPPRRRTRSSSGRVIRVGNKKRRHAQTRRTGHLRRSATDWLPLFEFGCTNDSGRRNQTLTRLSALLLNPSLTGARCCSAKEDEESAHD